MSTNVMNKPVNGEAILRKLDPDHLREGKRIENTSEVDEGQWVRDMQEEMVSEEQEYIASLESRAKDFEKKYKNLMEASLKASTKVAKQVANLKKEKQELEKKNRSLRGSLVGFLGLAEEAYEKRLYKFQNDGASGYLDDDNIEVYQGGAYKVDYLGNTDMMEL